MQTNNLLGMSLASQPSDNIMNTQHNSMSMGNTPMPMQNEAQYGRYGDTMMKPVDGVMSHVNPEEASFLDQGGPLAHQMLANSPQTINPITGRPEHFLGVALALAGGGLGLYGLVKGGMSRGGITKMKWKDAWDYSFGKKGFADWISGGKYSKEEARRNKIASINNSFDAGIGEFKDMNFADMSQAQRSNAIKDLLGEHATDADVAKYYDKYDWQEDQRTRSKGASEISSIGEGAQESLLGLSQANQSVASKTGFASTGNPQIDMQRRNIFKQITSQTGDAFTGLLDNIRGLKDAYNESIIKGAFAHKDALTS